MFSFAKENFNKLKLIYVSTLKEHLGFRVGQLDTGIKHQST
jgi:hypothetical protein